MPYRDDLDALSARHAALDAEVSDKTKERDAARFLLDEAHARAKLPVLDNIRVASPCSEDWSKMTGDDRVRACASCKQNVYDLSAMTRDEAEALLVERTGRLCVRYYQRSDGTILLADCVVGKRKRRRRVMFAAGLAGALAGAGVAYQTLKPRVELVDEPCLFHEPVQIQGGVSMPPSDPAPNAEPMQHVMGKAAPAKEALEPARAKMGRLHRVE